jgi:tripartite-type tricarboxylate transporter receptor subunit TctC
VVIPGRREALAALLSKNVDVLSDTVTALLGQVQSNQVTALAVTRKDRFPAVPAAIESGVVREKAGLEQR